MSKKYFSYFDDEMNIFESKEEARKDLQERLDCCEEHNDDMVEAACYGEIFGWVEEINPVAMSDLDEDDPRKTDSEYDYICELIIVDAGG